MFPAPTTHPARTTRIMVSTGHRSQFWIAHMTAAPTRPNDGYFNQNPTISSSPSLVSRLGSGLKNWRDQAGTKIANWLSPSSWTSPSTPSANSDSVWSTPPAPNMNTGTGPTWGSNTAPSPGWSAPVQPSSGGGSAWPTPPAPGTSAGAGWPAPPPNVGTRPISPSVPSSYYGPSIGTGTAPAGKYSLWIIQYSRC